MAIRVKVKRLKLIARLEEVRSEAKKQHKAALKKYATDIVRARNKVAADLRKKADKLTSGDGTLRIRSSQEYGRGESAYNTLVIESSVRVPTKPEERREVRDINRAIKLLDQSDDEYVSISSDELSGWGIGSITGLELED